VPAEINVIDGRRIDGKEVDQIFCVIDREEVAVNINTVEDLKMARELFEKRKPRH
jgi:GTP:adenosylcobinamide-phosphate guanylyltransferase